MLLLNLYKSIFALLSLPLTLKIALSSAGGGWGWIKIPNVKGHMPSNNYYNKGNQLFANKLRQNMTKAEVCLWKYALKAGKMKGYTFRR